jgi:hypothetical protein
VRARGKITRLGAPSPFLRRGVGAGARSAVGAAAPPPRPLVRDPRSSVQTCAPLSSAPQRSRPARHAEVTRPTSKAAAGWRLCVCQRRRSPARRRRCPPSPPTHLFCLLLPSPRPPCRSHKLSRPTNPSTRYGLIASLEPPELPSTRRPARARRGVCTLLAWRPGVVWARTSSRDRGAADAWLPRGRTPPRAPSPSSPSSGPRKGSTRASLLPAEREREKARRERREKNTRCPRAPALRCALSLPLSSPSSDYWRR